MGWGNRRRGQPWFAIAGLLLLGYAYNVAARIALVKFAVPLWHVGDVGECVLVLLSMAFFVGGVLAVAEHDAVESER